ncbi:MAG: hypothetical protein D6704_13355 [Nitrospirae bacterium]|nr:MAG: hypothetical protein D6704_13355 [Nitrospirota bacterium]
MSVQETYKQTLKDLASTMLAVARESVTLIKRSDPDHALKLTQRREWEIYLEFLKVMFNLADRISAYHVPLPMQPEFMDSLEDAVSEELKTVLAPTLSSSIDDQEIIMSVGSAVAESRRLYERYKFVVTEESKEKDGYFQFVGERIAAQAGAINNQAIASSAALCARAVIPAMVALFEGKTQEASASESPAPQQKEQPATASVSEPQRPTGQAIKLVSVVSRIAGEEIETRWGIFPQFRRDLRPDELKALTTHMNRVTRILGERFAALSASKEWENWRQTGHA